MIVGRSKRAVIKQLQGLGMPFSLAQQVYEAFGYEAVAEIQRDPYRLLFLNELMRWKEIDQFAQGMGVEEDSPLRSAGAVRYGLVAALNEGHVCLPREEIERRAAYYLGEETIDLDEILEELVHQRELAVEHYPENETIYLKRLHRAEVTIAELLIQLHISSSCMAMSPPVAEEMAKLEKDLRIYFAQAQAEAIAASFLHKIVIITGGPGTGKTTILKGLIDLWKKRKAFVYLAAPTGRAAKRLAESTDHKAATLHRTLEYSLETRMFHRNALRPLKEGLMVVDEASMMDTELLASLLEALPPSSHLLLVGDVDQLPSVGPGTVLHDLIESGLFCTIRLTEIFRQNEGSLISFNAQRINRGELPEWNGNGVEEGQDFFFIGREREADVQKTIMELVRERIPRQFGWDPRNDVQVLCPMNKRALGVEEMRMSASGRSMGRSAS